MNSGCSREVVWCSFHFLTNSDSVSWPKELASTSPSGTESVPYIYIYWLCVFWQNALRPPCSELWIITATCCEEGSVVHGHRNPSFTGTVSSHASSNNQTTAAGANHSESTREQSGGGRVVLRGAGTNHLDKSSLGSRALEDPKLRGLKLSTKGKATSCDQKAGGW